MIHIVTTSDPEILRHLVGGPLARMGVTYEAVPSGPAALEAVRRLRPRVAILQAEMRDLGGREVCREIRRHDALAKVRTVLVHADRATRALLDEVAAARCDDVIAGRVGVAEFSTHVQDLLDLSRRRYRRVPIELVAWVETGTRIFRGQAENLSVGGAKVRLDGPLGAVGTVQLRLRRHERDDGLVVHARVAWLRDGGREAGLEFMALTTEALHRLEALVLWDVLEEDGLLRVYLEGDLIESTDLAPLAERLGPQVDFDVAGVRHVNSHGARGWTAFLERLGGAHRYTFSRCSTAFVAQACFLPAFLGTGTIVSLMAPYRCADCEREETRLLEAAALVREGGSFLVPRFRCPGCGGTLSFDELPERYLACLAPCGAGGR